MRTIAWTAGDVLLGLVFLVALPLAIYGSGYQDGRRAVYHEVACEALWQRAETADDFREIVDAGCSTP